MNGQLWEYVAISSRHHAFLTTRFEFPAGHRNDFTLKRSSDGLDLGRLRAPRSIENLTSRELTQSDGPTERGLPEVFFALSQLRDGRLVVRILRNDLL